MELIEKEIVTKVKYLKLDKKLERPFQQVWDLMCDLDPSGITYNPGMVIEDEPLREFLFNEGVIDVDPVSGECGFTLENYDEFMLELSEMFSRDKYSETSQC